MFSCVGRLLLALSKVSELSRIGNSVSVGGGLSLCWLEGGGEGDSVLLTRVVEVPIDSLEPGLKVEYLNNYTNNLFDRNPTALAVASLIYRRISRGTSVGSLVINIFKYFMGFLMPTFISLGFSFYSKAFSKVLELLLIVPFNNLFSSFLTN